MKDFFKIYQNSFFASTSKGAEEILLNEFLALGVKNLTLEKGGISFEATDILAIKLVLRSKIASRIYRKLAVFSINSENDIYSGSNKIIWENIMSVDQSLAISSVISSSVKKNYPDKFKNSLYLSQVLKDSIVDHFRKTCGSRPSINIKNPDIRLKLRISEKKENSLCVAIYLDMCGEALNKRGYRTKMGRAPIKENLASTILELTKWDSENEIFIDPMCGSGTFLIEAALKKYNIPPSYLKVFEFHKNESNYFWGFQKHKFFTDNKLVSSAFIKETETISSDALKSFEKFSQNECFIFGSDINSLETDNAKINITTALLEDAIKVKKADATKLDPKQKNSGIILCNPPYGERIGETSTLESLYFEYGENLKKNFKGFKAYIFTGNRDLIKKISLKPSQKIVLFNGPIECRLVRYDIY